MNTSNKSGTSRKNRYHSDPIEILFEGGSVSTEDRDGKFLLHVNQVAMLDLLDPEDRDGIDPIKTHTFSTSSERLNYMRERGWLRRLMKDKLDAIFCFLVENRSFNRELQDRYYQAALLPSISAKDKVVSLLYEIVNTQSMPRISNISKFFVDLYGSGRNLDSFQDFIGFLGEDSLSYAALFHGLSNQSGWGDKTASLFVKSLFHTHNGNYDVRLRFWEDVPKTVYASDRFYLPVDAVILEIFNGIGSDRWTFKSINDLLDKYYQKEEIEVWDDLWFWGYFTQKMSNGERSLQWNAEKYWSFPFSDKNPSVIAEIESRAKSFVSLLHRLSIRDSW